MKKPMQKRIVTILAAAVFALGAGVAAAQSHGGSMGGGGMHGGGTGGMQGGGGWHGGGGNWNGGNNGWHGGGYYGGGYHGGYYGGGWYGGRWYGGTNVGFYFGLPGAWWWPGYYPYWGAASYGYASYPYYADASYVDPGPVVYIQRDQVADGNYAPAAPTAPMAPAPSMRSAPGGQFSYYCIDPPGYFPQVPQCAKGWLKVVPDGAARPTPIPQYPQ